MIGVHRAFDHILFAVLLLVPLIEWRWTWPRYLARLAAGARGARMQYYRAILAGEWLPVLCLLAYWEAGGWPWSRLLLGGSTAIRLGTGLVCAGMVTGLLWLQRGAVLARPEATARMRQKLIYAELLLPHTARERKAFWMVSATAGICEEILYRGFLIWYLAVWSGPIAAVVLSSLIFGLGHIYLGRTHVFQTALAGLIFACLALASASLWPAILLHAALDWNSGELGFQILRRSDGVSES